MAKKNTITKERVQLALDKHKWINTPVVYTTFGQNFTLFQQDVMLLVSGKMQNYIKQFLDENRYRDPDNPKSIFTPEQITEGIGEIRINFTDLKITDNHYDYIDKALDALRQLWVKAPVFDKETGKRMGDDYYPIFEKVFVPASVTNANGEQFEYKTKDNRIVARREGYIDVTINHQVAAYVFDMSHGYFNHLERIAYFCHSAYTSRMYMFLMRFVSRGQMSVSVPYMELKDFLGMIERDRKTNNIISVKYAKFSQFKKQVLDVSQKDMLRLSDELKTEIVFDYEPLYRGSSMRGDPEYIKFEIHRTDLGKAHEARLKRQTTEKQLLAKLTEDYPLLQPETLKTIFVLVTDEHWKDFVSFVRSKLSKIVEAPHRWGGTVETYVLHVLKTKASQYVCEHPTVVKPDSDSDTIKKAWNELITELSSKVSVTSQQLSIYKYDGEKRLLTLAVSNASVIGVLESDNNLPVFSGIIRRHFGNVKLQYYQPRLL